ncbi:hypothetical protein [Burkholderia sp. D-99]|uniref:hypothetical protein n=1 Tax=Burkholderia sp. D-99 TaxID=2717316 RepID=UPI00141E4F14|nr:hypothetical protein [Burkholderia sp. D-99]NHV30935.1 hypothetical protein [Burkholderia sp. D-99]
MTTFRVVRVSFYLLAGVAPAMPLLILSWFLFVFSLLDLAVDWPTAWSFLFSNAGSIGLLLATCVLPQKARIKHVAGVIVLLICGSVVSLPSAIASVDKIIDNHRIGYHLHPVDFGDYALIACNVVVIVYVLEAFVALLVRRWARHRLR